MILLLLSTSVPHTSVCSNNVMENDDFFFFFGLLFLQTIEANWRCGRHNLQRIQCRSENSKGVYCLQYDDDKIISGLRDNSIKVCMSSQVNRGYAVAVDMKAWE